MVVIVLYHVFTCGVIRRVRELLQLLPAIRGGNFYARFSRISREKQGFFFHAFRTSRRRKQLFISVPNNNVNSLRKFRSLHRLYTQKQSREALKKKNLERRLNAKNSNIKKNNDEISNERANFNHLQQ